MAKIGKDAALMSGLQEVLFEEPWLCLPSTILGTGKDLGTGRAELGTL